MPSRRLVLLHGFTQTGRSWAPVVARLPADGEREVLTPDCPGHGAKADVRVGLWDGGRLLADEAGRGDWCGYSMGGRFALHVALARPDVVDRLVLVSATAGIEDDFGREARRGEDAERAERIARDGVEDFLREWLRAPMFAGLTESTQGLEARRENTAGGLAASLLLAGTGAQEPLWGRLGELAVPVLLVVGANDEKFLAINRRMAAAIPGAELAVVPGSGHAVPWEQPDTFASLLTGFLRDPLQ